MACGASDNIYVYNINGTNINSSREVHSIFGAQPETFVNTENKTYNYIIDQVNVNKNFSFLDVTTQPYIYDETINNTVKIARQGQDPHAIMIPYDFKWAKEKICIKDAYSEFNKWGQNKIDATDWYKYPISGKIIE